jgi:hypothetical protein
MRCESPAPFVAEGATAPHRRGHHPRIPTAALGVPLAGSTRSRDSSSDCQAASGSGSRESPHMDDGGVFGGWSDGDGDGDGDETMAASPKAAAPAGPPRPSLHRPPLHNSPRLQAQRPPSDGSSEKE